MSFFYMCNTVEVIRKFKKSRKEFDFEKNIQLQLMIFCYISTVSLPDKQTCIYPPLDERYSPIISTTSGPNK